MDNEQNKGQQTTEEPVTVESPIQSTEEHLTNNQTNTTVPNNNRSLLLKLQPYLIPLAIIFGFALVAVALYASGQTVSGLHLENRKLADGNSFAGSESVRREESALVYGNPKAKTTIVEFSDFECPYCSRLHPVLQQIVDESDGKINWEYRHLPLSIHAHAADAALVGECVGEIDSNDLFWEYANEVFSATDTRTLELYKTIATSLGVDQNDLEDCIDSSEVRDRIQADVDVAQGLGGSGTPFSIVILPDGTQRPVQGALPYEYWQNVIVP